MGAELLIPLAIAGASAGTSFYGISQSNKANQEAVKAQQSQIVQQQMDERDQRANAFNQLVGTITAIRGATGSRSDAFGNLLSAAAGAAGADRYAIDQNASNAIKALIANAASRYQNPILGAGTSGFQGFAAGSSLAGGMKELGWFNKSGNTPYYLARPK